jgi:glutamine synthetase
MMQGSELFTGAALDGVPQDISDEEVAAMPDAQSATILPWNKEVVWFASDLYLSGQPFAACSRIILKRMFKQGREPRLQVQPGHRNRILCVLRKRNRGLSRSAIATISPSPATT